MTTRPWQHRRDADIPVVEQARAEANLEPPSPRSGQHDPEPARGAIDVGGVADTRSNYANIIATSSLFFRTWIGIRTR